MKVDLEEAQTCESGANPYGISGQVFNNGDNGFIMLPDAFLEDIDIVMSDDFPIEEETGHPVFPLKRFSPTMDYEDPVRQYYEDMNIDFAGIPTFYFGNFNGKIFESTSPTEAKDVIILVRWNVEDLYDHCPRFGLNDLDPDTESLFHYSDYAQDSYECCHGVDIYILPVGYVAEKEQRDVSDLLQKIQDNSGLEYPQHDGKQQILNNDGPSLDER